MRHCQGLSPVDRKGLRRADRVLDLPAVELVPRKVVEVVLGERCRVHLLEHAHSLDEDLEDRLLGSVVEVVVAQRNVDT